MRRVTRLLGGRLRNTLILAFLLVAALTVAINALVTSRVISSYLESAQAERVARDMDLARAFFQLKLDEVEAISHRLALDPWVQQSFPSAARGDDRALQIIDQEIDNKITVLALGGTHWIAVLDRDGRIITARVLLASEKAPQAVYQGNWRGLPIVEHVLAHGVSLVGTEIVPAEYLEQIGLKEAARIPVKDTPRAAEKPYDPREGSAGLAMVGASPLMDEDGKFLGVVIAGHLLNNDFTLVDRIRAVAAVDTVTIFFGDLRVSTNVRTAENERAVGTLVSKDVFDTVLLRGQSYVGRAFVVDQMYITQYEPVRDHSGEIVGILYVGARLSTFEALQHTFRSRMIVIALICTALAAILSVPISNAIVRPIVSLAKATSRLAQGDMNIRVEVRGSGELAVLSEAFNRMVTTLQETQQELLRKEKLASMGQLAAGIAHEINNPLGTIQLFADAMYKEASEEDPHRKDLTMIIREARRCKKIVADLLNFARQQEISAQEIDLHAIMDRVLESMKMLPDLETIKVARNYDASLPKIQADENQMHQLLSNLIKNAIDAMPDGGVLTLSTRALDHDWVEFTVEDTGVGIPKENLGHLFEPFFTTKGPGKGTGLGLAISYGIVKIHRGQIRVQSEEGKGTAFVITLPTRLSEAASRSGTQATLHA